MNTKSTGYGGVSAAYREKYKIKVISSWGGAFILEKQFARRKKYILMDWNYWVLLDRMKTGLEMGKDLVSEMIKSEGRFWQDKMPPEDGIQY